MVRHMQRTNIIRLIEILAATRGRSPHTVSFWVSGSGDLYARLRRGHDLTTKRANRILVSIWARWPADVDWPADIPRPDPSPNREAA